MIIPTAYYMGYQLILIKQTGVWLVGEGIKSRTCHL